MLCQQHFLSSSNSTRTCIACVYIHVGYADEGCTSPITLHKHRRSANGLLRSSSAHLQSSGEESDAYTSRHLFRFSFIEYSAFVHCRYKRFVLAQPNARSCSVNVSYSMSERPRCAPQVQMPTRFDTQVAETREQFAIHSLNWKTLALLMLLMLQAACLS